MVTVCTKVGQYIYLYICWLNDIIRHLWYKSYSVGNAGKTRVDKWMMLLYKNVTDSLVYNTCPYLSSKLLQGYFYKKDWGGHLPT